MDREEFRFHLVLVNAWLMRLTREMEQIHQENLQILEGMEKQLKEMRLRKAEKS